MRTTAAARRALEPASTRSPAPILSDIDPLQLSGRDHEVLSLLSWGYTNQQVADELYVSITTAKSYIHSAYLKIGVTRRTQAIVWGVRSGLATTPVATSPGSAVAAPWTRHKRLPSELDPVDLTAVHDAWSRLERANKQREAALVALYHLCSDLGVLSARHLSLVPGTDDPSSASCDVNADMSPR